jgi:hypothetical protein
VRLESGKTLAGAGEERLKAGISAKRLEVFILWQVGDVRGRQPMVKSIV